VQAGRHRAFAAVRPQPDHDEIREWFGYYDPAGFAEIPIKMALAGIAKHRRAGKARKKKG
jgi:hypothetical protein